MATKTSTKKSSSGSSNGGNRGRNQDRKLVAAGQKHEVAYEAKKSGASAADVKRAVKSAGNSRKKVERALSK